MPQGRLVLASASPRRRELLCRAGYHFTVKTAEIDESLLPGEPVLLAASRLACEKARRVATALVSPAVVLGADTMVVCAGEVFGKPLDKNDALAMLSRLAGRSHTVLTCWALVRTGGSAAGITGATRSIVRMRELGQRELEEYVASGEPLDKAGAYAVQGHGRSLVAAVLGSLENVIGLPVAELSRALARFGVVGGRP